MPTVAKMQDVIKHIIILSSFVWGFLRMAQPTGIVGNGRDGTCLLCCHSEDKGNRSADNKGYNTHHLSPFQHKFPKNIVATPMTIINDKADNTSDIENQT